MSIALFLLSLFAFDLNGFLSVSLSYSGLDYLVSCSCSMFMFLWFRSEWAPENAKERVLRSQHVHTSIRCVMKLCIIIIIIYIHMFIRIHRYVYIYIYIYIHTHIIIQTCIVYKKIYIYIIWTYSIKRSAS